MTLCPALMMVAVHPAPLMIHVVQAQHQMMNGVLPAVRPAMIIGEMP